MDKLIEALQATVKAQNDLITYLKAEVERLKSTQIVLNPPLQPQTMPDHQTLPGYPQVPINPCSPIDFPQQPTWPLNPWYGTISISKDGVSLTSSESLPIGAVQTDGKILVDTALNGETSTDAYLVDPNNIGNSSKIFNIGCGPIVEDQVVTRELL